MMPQQTVAKQGKFTGWHMLAIMVGFFGVVIAVNVTMMQIARGSFGGIVVENSYVASQNFNTWLDAARAQEELGWQVTSGLDADRKVAITVTGAPDPVAVTAMARHPLGRQPDQALTFHRVAPGRYVSTTALPAGRWTLRLQLASGTAAWRQEVRVQ
jgi:nitrogen fixation protein FixH